MPVGGECDSPGCPTINLPCLRHAVVVAVVVVMVVVVVVVVLVRVRCSPGMFERVVCFSGSSKKKKEKA